MFRSLNVKYTKPSSNLQFFYQNLNKVVKDGVFNFIRFDNFL